MSELHRLKQLLCVALIALLAACGQATAENGGAGEGGLNVVATTGQICDTVRNVAGEAIQLECLFGPGVDPHLYVPTEGDVSTLTRADVIFYNGLHLEAQFTRVMEAAAAGGKIVVALGDNLPPEQLLDWDSSAPYDPHIWNDPLLWKQVVQQVRDTLVAADPANAEQFAANSERYLAEIDETHAFVLEQIARIPEERRLMVTAHDAFGYFARTYGMEVAGLQGISTESEASVADVQTLGDLIVARDVPAIFVESSVSPRNIEALQAYVRSKGHDVVIGGSLYSDALGTGGTPEGTYLGMLRHNAQTLADALAQQ